MTLYSACCDVFREGVKFWPAVYVFENNSLGTGYISGNICGTVRGCNLLAHLVYSWDQLRNRYITYLRMKSMECTRSSHGRYLNSSWSNWCFIFRCTNAPECTTSRIKLQTFPKKIPGLKTRIPSIWRRTVIHHFNQLALKWRPAVRPWHDPVYCLDLGWEYLGYKLWTTLHVPQQPSWLKWSKRKGWETSSSHNPQLSREHFIREAAYRAGAVLRGAGGPRPPNEKCAPQWPPILAQLP